MTLTDRSLQRQLAGLWEWNWQIKAQISAYPAQREFLGRSEGRGCEVKRDGYSYICARFPPGLHVGLTLACLDRVVAGGLTGVVTAGRDLLEVAFSSFSRVQDVASDAAPISPRQAWMWLPGLLKRNDVTVPTRRSVFAQSMLSGRDNYGWGGPGQDRVCFCPDM